MPMTARQHDDLRACVSTKAERILFATACGPLLYGFPRQGRYVDLRGVHVELPAESLESRTAHRRDWREQRESGPIEWLSHEVGTFVRLLQAGHGSAYEQLFSPYEVCGQEALAELRGVACAMVSRPLFEHYREVFCRQLERFRWQHDRHGRHMLYLCRLALTGLHVAERGEILLDLPVLARFHERVAVLQLLEELDHQPDVRDPAPYMRELEALSQQLAQRAHAAKLQAGVPGEACQQAEAWLLRVRACAGDR